MDLDRDNRHVAITIRQGDNMLERNQAALDFLLNRRSRPSKTLVAPAPDADSLQTILTAAARTPDHGKLEPWRFVVLTDGALPRIGEAVRAHGAEIGTRGEDVDKAAKAFENSHMCVMVVEVQKPSKIPAIEQTYSAGAVCLALVNAALASGFGANWLSGWISHDRAFLETHLGLETDEKVAGFIHLGSESKTPPERPRPDLGKIVIQVNK